MKLVALEGIDGAGKTTIRRAMVDTLHRLGVDAAGSGEFESPIGPWIRRNLGDLSAREKVLLFAADRSLSLRAIAESAKDSSILLWDRYVASAYAYRSAEIERGGGNDTGQILPLLHVANAHFAHPDLYIYLDLDGISAAGRSEFPTDPAFLGLVETGYQSFFTECEVPVQVVNARQSVGLVLRDCMQALEDHGVIRP